MNIKFFIFKIISLAIIFSHLIYSIIIKKKTKEIYQENIIKINMGNYSFYNSFNFPLISIIIDFGRLKLDYYELEDYICSLLKQTIKDIEIIIYFYNKDIKNKSLIEHISSIDKRIHLYISNKNDKIYNIFKIVIFLKGKFVLLIEKLIKFHEKEFFQFYNYTKGKIENIFTFKTQSNYRIHLIRIKIMKDLMDNMEKFNVYKEIINYIKKVPSPAISYVPIAYCPNDKYMPLAYTSMISILVSRNYYSYIDFYLIVSNNFSEKNYKLLDSLFEHFFYFNITYIQMDNRYKNAFVHKYITNQAYFRFSLGNLIPNLNKIIYLDADTIAFKDLSNLYNLNFNGKIFLAKGLTRNKKNKKQIYINSGILLLNLKKMRMKKIEEKTLKILNNGFKHPTLHDQAVIDTYFWKYVGLFPPEYNSYFLNNSEKYRYISTSKVYNRDKLILSLKYPAIRHYKGSNKNLNEDWFFFARISKYFHKINLNYSIIFNF